MQNKTARVGFFFGPFHVYATIAIDRSNGIVFIHIYNLIRTDIL